MHLKVEQTRRAFHTVNIRPCATSTLQILFDPDTESKFRFVAICIERQRESKGPLPFPRLRPRKRGLAFRPENITPVKITRGKREGHKERGTLCARVSVLRVRT